MKLAYEIKEWNETTNGWNELSERLISKNADQLYQEFYTRFGKPLITEFVHDNGEHVMGMKILERFSELIPESTSCYPKASFCAGERWYGLFLIKYSKRTIYSSFEISHEEI